jgi:hypothetical protein
MDEPEPDAPQAPPEAEPDLYAVLGGASRAPLAAADVDLRVRCVCGAVSDFARAACAVARDASEEDIKRAYRALAQAVHPDKHPSAALREVRGLGGFESAKAFGCQP